MPKDPGPPELETDFRMDCLKWHNHYRHCHKAPPLELDQEVKQIHHRPKVGYTDDRVDVDLG